MIHLSIDAMGGDEGPRLVVEASLAFIKSHSDVAITLVGQQASIESLIPVQLPDALRRRVHVRNADQTVGMGDRVAEVLRGKQQSSMWVAVQMLAEGEADACVSAGNTGALMAIGRKLVKTCTGVYRPAICKPIPTARGTSLLLDLGANIECSSEQLVQFALMGAALARLRGVEQPRIALLNIGTEMSKGNDVVLAAAQYLRARDDLNFCGFVEGFDLYSGNVDVVVCDGLVGNVALKVSEGIARFMFDSLREHFHEGVWARCMGWLCAPVLRRWSRNFDPSSYNGAAFLGLKRTLVKSHGGASRAGFEQALVTAVEQVRAAIPERIEASLQALSAQN